MSFSDLERVSVADGKITRLSYQSGELCVWIVDWQGNAVTVRFQNAELFVARSPENEDLSHVMMTDTIPAHIAHDLDNSESHTLVDFISAWDDRELIRVVASNVVVDITHKPTT